MAIPFSLGKVLDIIYNSTEDAEAARTRLNHVCGALLCVFVLGAFCNFGRVYLMSTIGELVANENGASLNFLMVHRLYKS